MLSLAFVHRAGAGVSCITNGRIIAIDTPSQLKVPPPARRTEAALPRDHLPNLDGPAGKKTLAERGSPAVAYGYQESTSPDRRSAHGCLRTFTAQPAPGLLTVTL